MDFLERDSDLINSFECDIEKLAADTFKLSEDISNGKFVDNLLEISASPGIVYYIEKGMSTFCIRGIPCPNLKLANKRLISGDRQLLEYLKIDRTKVDYLKYFELEYFELTEHVFEQFINRRFPYNEDQVCNFGGPGFGWWFEDIDGGFRLYLGSYLGGGQANRTNQESNRMLLNLGLLGDPKFIARKLDKTKNELQNILGVSDISVSDRLVTVKVSDTEKESYKIFRNIFLKGELTYHGDFFKSDELFFLLLEICSLRGFWLSIQDTLG